MTLTKSQKICFALLGLGVCALAVDRSMGGQSGVADDVGVMTSGTALANTPPASTPLPNEVSAASGPSLADRLKLLATSFSDGADVRDAFAPSPRWFARSDTARSAPGDRAARFKASHTLKAVINAGRQGAAMVDGNLIRVGQSLDGFVLSEVSPLRATFVDGNQHIQLALPGAQTSENDAVTSDQLLPQPK